MKKITKKKLFIYLRNNMLEWKSFSVNDLFKDFNEVIDKAYNNTYKIHEHT